jgi:hypothetical protein
MRHPLIYHSWFMRTGRIFAAANSVFALVLAVSAFGQEPAVPPPPPDAQLPAQRAQPQSPDANNVRAVRLSDVEGKVQVFNGVNPAFDQAQPNMPAVEGMRFVTGPDGRLEIQFEDGSVARITPNSSVTLTQLHRNGDGSTQYTVRFGPNGVMPIDSSIFRINLDGNPADLAVTHGTVHVTDGQNLSLDLRTNHSIHFDTQNPGQYDLVQSVAADTWDQWNSDRDEV